MPLKISFIYDYQSTPEFGVNAASHKGGWSETIWQDGTTPDDVKIRRFADRRRALLPGSVRVIGFRAQVFTVTDAGLKAGGAATTLLGLQGNSGLAPDLPQVALSLVAKATVGVNTRRFSLRGIPDTQMKNGEWQPEDTFKAALTRFRTMLVEDAWLFPGRDLTQPVFEIEKIVNAKITLIGNPPFFVGQRLGLRKCRDTDGNPVTGQFLITAVGATELTLGGFDPDVVVGQKGTASLVSIQFKQIGSVEVGRACVRKIGRPFEGYRGRRSKRR